MERSSVRRALPVILLISFSRKLLRAVEGLEGEEYHGMALMETATNHNHEDILESVDAYAVRYKMIQP